VYVSSKVCAPIIVQSKNFNAAKNYTRWFLNRLSEYQGKVDTQVPQPKPGHCQGAHEEAMAWNTEHNTQAAYNGHSSIPVIPPLLPHVLPLFQQPPLYLGPVYGTLQGSNLVGMDDDGFIANVFCFGAFADKNNGVMYNDLTGSFPFISQDGSI
jgi:hypothetical protein